MSVSAVVATTTLASVLVVVNILGNSLVCVIIKKNRDMRSPINCLLVNLAVADILYAAFIIPKVFFNLIFTHPGGVTGTVLCKFLIRGTVAWVGGYASIITLVAVAVERYYASVYPFGNKWKLTKRKLKVVIPGIWVFALTLNIPMFLVVDTERVKDKNLCVYVWPEDWMGKANSWALLVFQTVIPLTLMVVLYAKVVCTLWFKNNDNIQLTNRQKAVIRKRKRVTLMVVSVSVMFGICWGAESIEYVLRNLPSVQPYISPAVILIVDTMVLFNSAVNPFVYALLNQQFREKMKKMICCSVSSASRVRSTPEVQGISLADLTTYPTHIAIASCTAD